VSWNIQLTPRSLWCVLKGAVQRWIDQRCMSRSAALAYYAAFSLAPILVIVIAVAGLAWGRDSVEGHVLREFENLLGAQGAALVRQVALASHISPDQTWATGLSVAGTLVGATALFAELADAISALFGRTRTYRKAWMTVALERLRGLALVVGIGVLLLASLVLSAALVWVSAWVAAWTPLESQALGVLQTTLSFVLLSSLFALMLRVLAPVRLRPATAWLGGMATALLFELGKWLVGLYLGHSSVGSVFGAAGTLAVMLVWLNYVGMTLLFGVALTAELHGLQGQIQDRTSGRDPQKVMP
jgi:membrane protein